jgi:large repetitive protein
VVSAGRIRYVVKIAGAIACSVVASLLLASAADPCAFGRRTEDRHAIQAQVIKDREQQTRAETWFLHGRIVPGQSAALRYRAHQQKMRMREERRAIGPTTQASGSTQLAGSVWTSLGPAPLASDASGVGQQDYNWVSGRATAVTIDSADSTANTVYVGGAYGGVWKSSNAATANPASVVWTPLIDNQATLAVGAIAIQPQLSNPDPAKSVILVGTGEANSSADSYYGLGILRSADAGKTWNLISSDGTGTRLFAGMAFSKIAFSTISPTLVVAATAGASEGIVEGLANPLTANLGLYYSTDGGLSWTYANVQDGSTSTAAGSATAVMFDAAAGQFFAALRYHGIYSSADGINWSRLANQPGVGLTTAACPVQPSSSTCPIYRGELAVVPGRNEMYVWYVDANDNDQGIWETIDGGNTWVAIKDAGITNCGDELGCGTQGATYNLELAAVPDGGATDLYAGAINLYKCQITSASPNCSGTGPNTFLNLTHAYGCSAIATVHPAQHAASFLLLNNNTQDVMYFANDGGIYRALDGYSGLTTGSCGSTNQFDSLNQTLGSMTQFVSFAQASTDPNTILGGAQGNGFPATQSALAGTTWLNVNAGDGGYTAINPENESEWFVSSPPNSISGLNIFRCASGISCHTQDFQNDQIVNGTTLGGDTGAYHAPFMLDPQNSGELVVGTCRVWRGSSSGTGFTALSNDFETGGDGICTGSETNLVNALAAGGPVVSGSSNVIYAGTDGFGPLIPTTPAGGHVWVSTSGAGGPSTWIDQTAAINPQVFPISGIAIDTSDATGLTAYVSIMGFSTTSFPTSHVWKTINGGALWTDFTGNLPDAPVNAVFVDPGLNPMTGTVYVATDVGVFSSYTASPNWTEVGPAPGSGQSGYLPNVAVTALRMFNTGQDKLLRASTYGRGLWQFPLITTPDFLISVSNTPMTVFAGSQSVFQGIAFSLDAYANSVQLSCISGPTPPPATCSIIPGTVTPTSSGAPFTITTNAPDGTYNFNIHGIGSDSGPLTHDTPVTLNVVDFNLSAPSVSAITVHPGTTSASITFQVTAAGPFNQAVTLSCAGLPAETACGFRLSGSADPIVPVLIVYPTASAPVPVTLTITTDPNTTAGTFSININGSAANWPVQTQHLSLTVIKDYSITIANKSLTAVENSTATFHGTLAWLNTDGSGNGYSSPVNLSCGTGEPSTCTVAPATVVPTASGAGFTVTVGSNQCRQYNFNILAQGTDPLSTSHAPAVQFTSTSPSPINYTLEIANSPPPTAVNTLADFSGTLQGTLCYDYPVNLSCGSGSPPLANPHRQASRRP